MKIFNTLLLSLLIVGALAEIGPHQPMRSHTLLRGDMFSRTADYYFNIESATFPVAIEALNAQAANQTEAIITRHFKMYNFSKLEWIKHINQDNVIFCYDDNQIVLQTMNGEGKSFGDHFLFTAVATTKGAVCHDVVDNRSRKLLYVGCITKNPNPRNPAAIFIATYDYT